MKKVIKLLIGEQPTSEMERLPKDNPPAMFWVSNVQFSPMSNFRGRGSKSVGTGCVQVGEQNYT